MTNKPNGERAGREKELILKRNDSYHKNKNHLPKLKSGNKGNVNDNDNASTKQ